MKNWELLGLLLLLFFLLWVHQDKMIDFEIRIRQLEEQRR